MNPIVQSVIDAAAKQGRELDPKTAGRMAADYFRDLPSTDRGMDQINAALAPVIADHWGPDVSAKLAVDRDSAGYVLLVTKRVMIPDLKEEDDPAGEAMWKVLSAAIDSVLKETP